MTVQTHPDVEDVRAWWKTGVSRIEPNIIQFRGYPIQSLIGERSFVEVIWLLVRGDLPTPGQARLLEAALVASADHGPQAPSIAVARMTATCGVGLNSAMASAVNTLGDVHGGAGQEFVAVLRDMRSRGGDPPEVARDVVAEYAARGAYVPGFGHRFHTKDPRRDPLLALLDEAVATGCIEGEYLRCTRALESVLNEGRSRLIPINVDGATATVYAELGVEPELARGLFVLSRSVGILAHAWEEKQTGRRIKGPLPPPLTAPYDGPETRLPG
jgi:citrate synthase